MVTNKQDGHQQDITKTALIIREIYMVLEEVIALRRRENMQIMRTRKVCRHQCMKLIMGRVGFQGYVDTHCFAFHSVGQPLAKQGMQVSPVTDQG